jgi:UDP-N-acetylglucosamine acyltransferase
VVIPLDCHGSGFAFLAEITGAAMSYPDSPRIHPTALISAEAELAPDVQIGPYVVIQGEVKLGAGCVVKTFAHLIGRLSMGQGNVIFSGAVLGEQPQHLKYAGEATGIEIGDNNIFRENVTIHRGTTHSWMTRIGSNNFFMAGSHVAHDCVVGNNCILANGALLGGHCTVEDSAYLSGNCAVHQFVRIGRLALLSGSSATTKDIPPFIIQQNINNVVGVNVVGMRRAGMSTPEIEAVRQAFHIIFHSGMVLPAALAKVQQELGAVASIAELVAFIRQTKRGINNASRDRLRTAA